MGFKRDFVWGVATASYQIEGAAYEDGKGLSIWDVACKRPGYIREGHTGDVACDHYHRYKEDVVIMKEIGAQAYRLSISWPRVLPEGTGRINQKGLDYYDRLIDELLSKGIDPYVTLFHWDYPHELHKRGGWLNDDSSEWFAEYARVIVDKLSDRVGNWFTLNEPQCFIGFGLLEGRLAPAARMEMGEVLAAAHNSLLAHGKAAKTIRQFSKKVPRIGIAPAGQIAYPATVCDADIEAARQDMFATRDKLWNNAWWMDPIYLGKYPEDGIEKFGNAVPKIGQDDMKIISEPLDFFGTNSYNGYPVKRDEFGKPVFAGREVGYPENAREWPITFNCLYWGAKFFYERYKLPIVITENGMPNCDWVGVDGKVHDHGRIDFYYRNIKGLKKAADEGIPVEGFFAWSLLDNFEWLCGYTKRFGLVHVDYTTQKRTIKDSGYWYKTLIESNGEILV